MLNIYVANLFYNENDAFKKLFAYIKGKAFINQKKSMQIN